MGLPSESAERYRICLALTPEIWEVTTRSEMTAPGDNDARLPGALYHGSTYGLEYVDWERAAPANSRIVMTRLLTILGTEKGLSYLAKNLPSFKQFTIRNSASFYRSYYSQTGPRSVLKSGNDMDEYILVRPSASWCFKVAKSAGSWIRSGIKMTRYEWRLGLI